MEKQAQNGISAVAFGAIFLKNARKYREERLRRIDIAALFPLWRRRTDRLIRQFNFCDLNVKT